MGRKDRERAKAGILFRGGHYLPAEQVPGTEAYKARQAKVDEAIRVQMSLKAKGVLIARRGHSKQVLILPGR